MDLIGLEERWLYGDLKAACPLSGKLWRRWSQTSNIGTWCSVERKEGMVLMRFKEKLFQHLERKAVYQVVQKCFKASILGVFQAKMCINLKQSGLSLTLNFFEQEVGTETFVSSFCFDLLLFELFGASAVM